MRLILLALICLASASLIGCGSSGPDMVPVTGVVELESGPIPMAEVRTINFLPADISDKKSKASSGDIQPDGSFRIKNVEGDGARPGVYKIEIKLWASYRPPHNSLIPEEYELAGTTPLRETVDASKTNHFMIKIPAKSAGAAAKK